MPQYRYRMTRHAISATMTSTGHITQEAPLLVGPADALTGPARYREVYRRARQRHSVRSSLRIVLHAYRHGVTLSGWPTSTGPE